MKALKLLATARVRIALVAATVATLNLGVAALATHLLLRNWVFRQLDEELDTLVEAIGSDIEVRGLEDLQQDALRSGMAANTLEFKLEHHSAVLFSGRDIVAKSGDLAQPVQPKHLGFFAGRTSRPFTAPEPFSGQSRLCRFQVASLGGRAAGATLVVFRPLEGPLRWLAGFDRALVLTVAAGAAISWLAVFFAVKAALGPVAAMTQAARTIEATSLHQRVPQGRGGTEFRELAAVINSLLDRLERAFQAHKRLTADTAHELKTPLSVIAAAAEEALRPDTPEAERASALETIRQAALGLSAGVESLLELARSDVGLARPKETLDAPELIEEAIVRVEPLAASRGVRITWETCDATVVGDRQGLVAMLANLLENAALYSPAGSTVELAAGTSDTSVWFEVRDRGPGIPPEARQTIFQRFARLSHGRQVNPFGSGLGLAIVAEVAKEHGGHVEVREREGGGSCFRVELPLATKKSGPATGAGTS
ncbi:MAG: HAMP domain-containing sensor histidine kinase [Thermoanaerobaculum sp.]